MSYIEAPVATGHALNAMADIIEIAEMALDAGFTLYGRYVRYRAWCTKHNLDHLNSRSIFACINYFRCTTNTLCILNVTSKSVKKLFNLISSKYRPVVVIPSITGVNDRMIFPDDTQHIDSYELFRANDSIHCVYIDVYKSAKTLSKYLIFDTDALCYSRITGYSLLKKYHTLLSKFLNMSKITHHSMFEKCQAVINMLNTDKK